MKEPEVVVDSRGTMSSRHSLMDAPMNSKVLWDSTQDLHRFKTDKIPALRKEVIEKSYLQSRRY